MTHAIEPTAKTGRDSALSRIVKSFRNANPWALDAVLVAVYLVVGFLSTSGLGQYDPGQVEDRDAFGVLLILGIVLPYLFRRRYPLAVLMFTGALVVVYVAVPYNEGALPTLIIIGTYTVGAWCSTRKGIVGMAFVVAALLVVVASDAPRFTWGDFIVNVLAYSAAFFFGTTVRARRLRSEALEQRAEALESEQEEKQARVLADERLRIAHELHDVIAHSMGVIAVQAGVGAHVIDSNPQEAKRALTAASERIASFRYVGQGHLTAADALLASSAAARAREARRLGREEVRAAEGASMVRRNRGVSDDGCSEATDGREAARWC